MSDTTTTPLWRCDHLWQWQIIAGQQVCEGRMCLLCGLVERKIGGQWKEMPTTTETSHYANFFLWCDANGFRDVGSGPATDMEPGRFSEAIAAYAVSKGREVKP